MEKSAEKLLYAIEWELQPDSFSCLKHTLKQDFSHYDCYIPVGMLWHYIPVVLKTHSHIIAVGKKESWVFSSVSDFDDFISNKKFLND